MLLTSSNQTPCNTPEPMLTVLRPLELGMPGCNKIPLVEECGHDKNLAPNIPQNFEPTIASHNNLESVREKVIQRTRPSHTEIDRKIEEEFSSELEDCSKPYTEDIRNVCRRILKRITEAHEVEICVIFWSTNEVVVIGEKAKTIENEIIQELAHLNLPKIHVENINTDFEGLSHVELLSKITKMLLESNEWISDESAFCELIVSAQDKDSGESDGKSTYAVIPAHLILTAEQTERLTIGDGDIAQVLEKMTEQGNQCKYIFTNENQEEFDDFHPSSLIAYRYWDRRSAPGEIHNETQVNNNLTEQVTVEWEESSSFMNDVAFLKFADDQQPATAEETEVFPIPTRRHLELLARRKQRIFVGDLEGTLIHNPETFGCVSKQYGLHLSFAITSRDSDGKICELEKGSSGLIVSFKGRDGKLRPVGMLIGRLTAQVERLNLSIYQATVLSQALKEIADEHSLQISDYKLMQTCHETSSISFQSQKRGINTVNEQMAVETAVHGSSDSELVEGGKEVSANHSVVKSKTMKQRAVSSEDSQVGEMSQTSSGASVDGRFTVMGTRSFSYCKLRQLLYDYVYKWSRPNTTELQQFLQAVTPEQRYELVTEVRDEQFTAIHKAAFLDHKETISCILDSFTAELRYKLLKLQGGMNGSTAIHFAALRGHAEAMTHMLDKVSPEHRVQLLDTKDKNIVTPLDLALRHNNQQAADCIRSYKECGYYKDLGPNIPQHFRTKTVSHSNLESAEEKLAPFTRWSHEQIETKERHLSLKGVAWEAVSLASALQLQKSQITANTKRIFKIKAKRFHQASLFQRKPIQTAALQLQKSQITANTKRIFRSKDKRFHQASLFQRKPIQTAVLGQQVIDKKAKLVELKGDILKAEQQIQEQEVTVPNAPENIPVLSATTEGHGVQLHVQKHDVTIGPGPIPVLQLQGVEQNTQIKANTEGIFKNIDDILQQRSLFQRTPRQTAELPEDCCIEPEQEVDRPPTPAGNFPQVQLKEEVPRLRAKLEEQEVLNQQKAQQIEGGDVSRQREDFSSNKGPVDPTPGPSLELRDEEEDMLLESSCKEIAEATSHIGDDRHSVLPNKRTEGSLIDEREDVPPLPPRDYPTSSPTHGLKEQIHKLRLHQDFLNVQLKEKEQLSELQAAEIKQLTNQITDKNMQINLLTNQIEVSKKAEDLCGKLSETQFDETDKVEDTDIKGDESWAKEVENTEGEGKPKELEVIADTDNLPKTNEAASATNNDSDSSDFESDMSSDDDYCVIPADLISKIKVLCENYSIEDCRVLQHPYHWQHITVSATNASTEIAAPLRVLLEEHPQYAKFHVTTFDRKEERQTHQLHYWQQTLAFDRETNTYGQAICELIVESGSNPKKVFVVGPAHFLFCAEANEKFKSQKCDIASIRNDIRKTPRCRTVTMQSAHSVEVKVEQTPLIGYRYNYQQAPPADKPHKLYTNDCVLFPFDTDKVPKVQRDLKDSNICRDNRLKLVNSIVDLQHFHFIRMRVAVQDHRGKLYHMVDVEQDVSYHKGVHLNFTLDADENGNHPVLRPGASGSIVYHIAKKSDGIERHQPLGMLIGVKYVEELNFDLYEAVVLNQVFKDIQDDYRTAEIQLVQDP